MKNQTVFLFTQYPNLKNFTYLSFKVATKNYYYLRVIFLTPQIIIPPRVQHVKSVWCCHWENPPLALWIGMSVINSAK